MLLFFFFFHISIHANATVAALKFNKNRQSWRHFIDRRQLYANRPHDDDESTNKQTGKKAYDEISIQNQQRVEKSESETNSIILESLYADAT